MKKVSIKAFFCGLVFLSLIINGCSGSSSESNIGNANSKQAMSISLSKELEPYRLTIEESVRKYIQLQGSSIKDTNIYSSKFGGTPYFPKDAEYPLDEFEKPMFLLAQINFADLPETEHFPDSGILQFYISLYDDIWGIDFADLHSQKNFRALYFDTIETDTLKLVDDFSFVSFPEDYYSPLERETALSFKVAYEPVGMFDIQFESYFKENIYDFFSEEQFGLNANRVFDFYAENFNGSGHKMDGYAFFTQYDPRSLAEARDSILLLQIDSDYDLGIMWGDMGVANFFITKEDLENRDFSNVMYTWDCY